MDNKMNTSKDRVIAFIDIGTNSISMLLVRIHPDKTYTVLSNREELVRLGEGEFVDQSIKPEAIQRAVEVCRNFTDLARHSQAERMIAVATSAIREASNRGELIEKIKDTTGLDVRAISGLEESRLVYLGIASGMDLQERQALFVDIGGGSTKLIVGDHQHHYLLDSLKLGSLRLTSMFFLPNEQDPIATNRYNLLKQYIRNNFVRSIQRIQPYKIDVAVGAAGTLLNLVDIVTHHFYNRPRTTDEIISHDQLNQVIELLCEQPLAKRREIPGIEPERANSIVAGAAIIDTLMDSLKLSALQVSDRSLRDGMLVDYLERTNESLILGQMNVRERSVLNFARTVNFDESHARQVARLALQLYDSAFHLGLHKLGRWERELLEYAALLHDIGAFLSYQNHQMHSYYLVLNADLLGFDQKESAIMALASLHHRKGLPSIDEKEFQALDEDSQKAVIILSMMLHLAESLDRGHVGAVHRVHFIDGTENNLILEVLSNQDCQLELWGVHNHLEEFEKLFHRPLEIRLVNRSS
jgi:exopolyphosphatase/guanosine-5'-triphosphate,3'-diphosphate pyrophosphatase